MLFFEYKDRDKIFKTKIKLKGTGTYVREDMLERVLAVNCLF